MKSESDKRRSYSNLLIVILVFSAVAIVIFNLYLNLREDFFFPLEPYIIMVIICAPISLLARRMSEITGIEIIVWFVSYLSSIIFYELIVAPTMISTQFFKVLSGGVIGGYLGLIIISIVRVTNRSIHQKKTNVKSIVYVIGSIGIITVFVFVIYNYFNQIISMLDSHPWAVTLLGIFMSLIVGVYFGRKSRR